MQYIPELPDVGGPVDDGGDPGVLGECLGVNNQDVPVPPPYPGHRPGSGASQSNGVRFKLMRLFWLKINHRLMSREILVTQRYSH